MKKTMDRIIYSAGNLVNTARAFKNNPNYLTQRLLHKSLDELNNSITHYRFLDIQMEEPIKEKECPVCGNRFIPEHRSDQIYCSKTCKRKKNYKKNIEKINQRNRGYYQKHKEELREYHKNYYHNKIAQSSGCPYNEDCEHCPEEDCIAE